jgi:5-deoxy-glucuronate isomerase
VLKIKHNDAVKFFDGFDHSQVAAPGYAMWYLWAIRHLDGAAYTVPENTKEHEWVLKKDAPIWEPKDALLR